MRIGKWRYSNIEVTAISDDGSSTIHGIYGSFRCVDFIVSDDYPNKFIIDFGSDMFNNGVFVFNRYVLITKKSDGSFYAQHNVDGTADFVNDGPEKLVYQTSTPLGYPIDDRGKTESRGLVFKAKNQNPRGNRAFEMLRNKTLNFRLDKLVDEYYPYYCYDFKIEAKDNRSRHLIKHYTDPIWSSDRASFDIYFSEEFTDRFIIDTQVAPYTINNEINIDRYYLVLVDQNNYKYFKPIPLADFHAVSAFRDVSNMKRFYSLSLNHHLDLDRIWHYRYDGFTTTGKRLYFSPLN